MSTTTPIEQDTRPEGGVVSPGLDFFAGTVAGIASVLTGHPFDTIKVKLQTQPQQLQVNLSSISSKSKNSAWNATKNILRDEGFKGLYKGVTSPMLGVALMNASVFTTYKLAMNTILLNDPEGKEEPTLEKVLVAGSLSGVFTSFITTPIERLKILQQSSTSVPTTTTPFSHSFPSSSHSIPTRTTTTSSQPSLLHLLRTHSLKSLYRGFIPTLLRDTAYGPYFLVYEYVVRGGNFGFNFDQSGSGNGGGDGIYFDDDERNKRGRRHRLKSDLREEVDSELWGTLPNPHQTGSVGTRDDGDGDIGEAPVDPKRILVAGGLAGIVGWGITFPIDVVKTKMQSTSLPNPSDSSSLSNSTRLLSSTSTTPTPASTITTTTLNETIRRNGSMISSREQPHRYRTLRSTFIAAWREGGWRVFVAGLGPTLVRSVPVNMVTFAVFETVVSTFR